MAHTYTPFERYDEEFKSLKKQVQDSLQEEDQDEEVSGHTSSLLGQCDELLKQMALEARSVENSSLKRELLAQVRSYKTEWQKLKDDYNKKVLLAGSSGRAGNNHRERLLQQQDMLLNQNSQLENARKVLEETEQVALEITGELANNRETIESAHGRVRSIAGLTGRARRILSSMSQRQSQQRMILYGLAGGVIVFFLMAMWWMRQ